jgi:hypothetical protein
MEFVERYALFVDEQHRSIGAYVSLNPYEFMLRGPLQRLWFFGAMFTFFFASPRFNLLRFSLNVNFPGSAVAVDFPLAVCDSGSSGIFEVFGVSL